DSQQVVQDVVLFHELENADESDLISSLSAQPWNAERNLMFLATLSTRPALGILVGLAHMEDEAPGPWREGGVTGFIGGTLEAGLLKVLSRGTMGRALK